MKFTRHAVERCAQRGISPEIVNELWQDKRFVLYRLEGDIRHYVAFIEERSEFFIMVVSGDNVVTVMPSIWRDKSIPDPIKDEAMARVKNRPVVRRHKVHVHFLNGDGKCEGRISYPRGSDISKMLGELRRVPQYCGKTVNVYLGNFQVISGMRLD